MSGSVSVDFMIPFWGDPDLLAGTVDSLLRLPEDGWRATVVDDASPWGDRVRDIVLAHRDPRLRYVRNVQNLGITGNFQRCLEMSTAEFVVIPGCDDLVLPGFVSALRESLRRVPDAVLFQPSVEVIDGRGRVVLPLADRVKRRYRSRHPVGEALRGDRLAASLLDANWLYFPACAFRRRAAAAIGFDTRWRVVEDLALILQLLREDGALVLSDTPGLQYRRHDASVSSVTAVGGERFEEEEVFFAEQAEAFAALGWQASRAAAGRHLTSRLHALTLLPHVRSAGTARRLLRHVIA